uniref:Uncharacterized protein n=1 Tax=Anguilla anguilla TaxID=7936 RepID=A0A0E9UN84_ANGAN
MNQNNARALLIFRTLCSYLHFVPHKLC